jgi:2,4-dienoyl-CoA reductase-like NADH-dependent reductase (Old Yellow Enzyme family)/thioredoxin reductase
MADLYRHLLSPGRIGSMTLRNRIVMTAMGSNQAELDGTCGEGIRAYYAERAKGGVGLIIVEATAIAHPIGTVTPRQVGFSGEQHMPGMRALVDAVHAHGAKIAIQLHMGGLNAVCDTLAGRPLWAPSVPPPPVAGDAVDGFLPDEFDMAVGRIVSAGGFRYKVLSPQDIGDLVQLYVAAAQRATRIGIDGLEIHAGHGYIISSFLSPHTNQRTDQYGGSIENRTRLLVDVVRAVRSAVGPDYPVWARLDSQEFLQREGISLEDAKTTARLAQEAGLDAINVTAYADMAWGMGPTKSYFPEDPGYLVPNATAIKSVLSIPVITVGRIEPELADRYIGEGKLDFIAMGRKLLADPHLPRKLQEGRAGDVRPCIYCYACISQIYFERPVKCTVNPETAHERDLIPQRTEHPKRVVVIGGGPGGMEVARRLALKGHAVTLLEKWDRLGGTLNFAAIAYPPNERLLRWLERQLAALKVEVRLKVAATTEVVRALAPDHVIVAVGARRAPAAIPGADQPNVLGADELRQMLSGSDKGIPTQHSAMALATRAFDLLGITKSAAAINALSRVWMPFGKRVVIIGSELVALELAEFLGERGRAVTIIDDAPKFGKGLPVVRRWVVLDKLRHLDVTLIPEAGDIRIGSRQVSYKTHFSQIRALAADTVLIAKGAESDLSLADQLRLAGFTVEAIGDCTGVGYIEGAMRRAAEVVQSI